MRRKQRGSVLIAVIVILIITTFGAVALTITIQSYAQSERKYRDEIQSHYAAEAGTSEVISWFNTSGTVIAHQAPTLAPIFQQNADLRYENLANALRAGDINVADYGSDLLPVLCDASGHERGRVTSLQITTATAQEQVAMPYLICIVDSHGQAQGGSTKRVRLYLSYQRLVLDGAPGVIESHSGAALGGNAKGHWGEVWAHGNMDVQNMSQVPTQAQDPWLRYRSEAYLVFPSNWGPFAKWGKPILPGSNTIMDPANAYPCAGVSFSDIGVNYGQMMQQNQTLRWPTYPYDVIKRIALRKGRYYSTDAAGNLYRNGIEDASHLVSDISELNVPGDRSQWPSINPDVIFVDTIDGNPPDPLGSNLATIRLSGSGVSWKGFYYIGANLDLSGLGSPSAISCKDPAAVPHDLGAFMDGILIIKGWVSVSGNPIVYGSVYAERGLTGTGTMDCYYNVELKNGGPKIKSNVESTRVLVSD